MRTLIILFTALLFFAPSEPTYNTPEEKIAFYHDVFAKYFPEGLQLISKENDILRWTKDEGKSTTRSQLLNDLEFVVHESNHLLHHSMRRARYSDGYYLGDSISIPITYCDKMETKEIMNIVPKLVQDRIFRFDLYAGESSTKNAANINGIFGLIEEMTAYYNGSRAEVAMFDFYRTFCDDDDYSCWGNEYLQEPVSGLVALNEFRLFVAWYLVYAKEHYPEIYDQIMAHNGIRVVYTLLERKYEALQQDFQEIRALQIKRMNKAGLKVTMTEKNIVITKKNFRWTCGGTREDQKRWLDSLITPEMAVELEAFHIAEVTDENYKDFL